MKTYLITGATSGIGKSLIETFGDEKVRVIALGRDEEKLSQLKEKNSSKVEIIPIVVDLDNVLSIKGALSGILSEKIDGFIHCAGFYELSNLRKVNYSKFLSLMNVNFFSFVEI